MDKITDIRHGRERRVGRDYRDVRWRITERIGGKSEKDRLMLVGLEIYRERM